MRRRDPLQVARDQFNSLMQQARVAASLGDKTKSEALAREAKAMQPEIARLYRASF